MKILFMCVGNSARSQMAEAIGRQVFGNRVQVRSAGSHPDGFVHPLTLKVLNEIGVSTTNLVSKGVTKIEPEFIGELDFVIPLCAENVCPKLPGDSQKLEWVTADPTAAKDKDQTEAFRKTRDFIKRKIEMFNSALLRCEAEEELGT